MAATGKSIDGNYPVERNLWWLIVGRLSAAVVLLLASTAWIRSTGQQRWDRVFPIFAVVVFLTIAYTLAHQLSKKLLLQARIQFTLDVFLVTWLVWTSDVIHSPYTAIYIVVIARTSVLAREPYHISGCALMSTSRARCHSGRQPSPKRLCKVRFLSDSKLSALDIAFFVVGLLLPPGLTNRARFA